MKKKDTINLITNLIKVSTTSNTISRATCEKSGNYSKKSEEKVLDIIKRYNYNSPDIIAKTTILCDYHEPALSVVNGQNKMVG